jgi:hypothetical protein
MGKKKHRHDWPEAKKLCRLNQNDIAMAKSLGFGPDSLVRNRPDPKQKWKLPVKYWIHELHFKRFGFVLGEKPEPLPAPRPTTPEEDEETQRLFEEELYWEDYRARNQEDAPKRRPGKAAPPAPAPAPAAPARAPEDAWMDEVFIEDAGDRDVPF